MKRRPKDLTKEELIVTLDALYTAASAITGRGAVKLFLRDLLTPSERVMLGRRIIIARMLISGTSYDEIGKRMRVGSATIGRVHRWLKDQFPGFEQAVAGMEKNLKRETRKECTPLVLCIDLRKNTHCIFCCFLRQKAERLAIARFQKRLR